MRVASLPPNTATVFQKPMPLLEILRNKDFEFYQKGTSKLAATKFAPSNRVVEIL
jgi:hypothetical protein